MSKPYVINSKTTRGDIFQGVFLALVLFDLLGRLF
jgi:hypothetical protein